MAFITHQPSAICLAAEDQRVGDLVPLIGVKGDDGEVVLAGEGHRVWRIRRNGLALHEQDAAHDGVRLRDLDGGSAIETASDYKGLALLRLLLAKLLDVRHAGDLRRCMKGRARNEGVLRRGKGRKGFTGHADGQGVVTRLVPARRGAHQIDAYRVVAIGRKNTLEVLPRLADVHRYILAAGRQHIEVVRQVRSLERNSDRLPGADAHEVVHIRIALQLAIDGRRSGALRKLHPLGADTRVGSGCGTDDGLDKNEYRGNDQK